MKTKISLVLFLISLATLASAAAKYVSTDFGFAGSYPADVVRSQISSDVASFTATAPASAWVAQVKVVKNVAMPREITKQFMEAKLAEVLSSGV